MLACLVNTLTLAQVRFGGLARLLLHEKPQHEQPQSALFSSASANFRRAAARAPHYDTALSFVHSEQETYGAKTQ